MKALGRTLLSALLLTSISSSAGAQFFDLPWPATKADERSEAPRTEPDRGPVPDRDPQPEPEPEPEREVAAT
ncbi:MAG: hypothetical protein WBM47_17540, partial [Polyangiales bacterium]